MEKPPRWSVRLALWTIPTSESAGSAPASRSSQLLVVPMIGVQEVAADRRQHGRNRVQRFGGACRLAKRAVGAYAGVAEVYGADQSIKRLHGMAGGFMATRGEPLQALRPGSGFEGGQTIGEGLSTRLGGGCERADIGWMQVAFGEFQRLQRR